MVTCRDILPEMWSTVWVLLLWNIHWGPDRAICRERDRGVLLWDVSIFLEFSRACCSPYRDMDTFFLGAYLHRRDIYQIILLLPGKVLLLSPAFFHGHSSLRQIHLQNEVHTSDPLVWNLYSQMIFFMISQIFHQERASWGGMSGQHQNDISLRAWVSNYDHQW